MINFLSKILCHRRASDGCCENHAENGAHSLSNHRFSVANLVNNIRPVMITSADLEVNGISKNIECQKNKIENMMI